MKKAEVILEWQRPKEAGVSLSKKALKRGWCMLFRMVAIVAIVELVVYWGFCKLPLEETDFNFGKALILSFLFIAGICLLAFVFEPLFLRYKKVLYQLNEDGIFEKSGVNRILSAWEKIEDYSLINDETPPNFHTIRYQVLGWERTLILPTRELANEALKVFEEKVEIKEAEKIIKLNRRRVYYLSILCVISVGMLFFMILTAIVAYIRLYKLFNSG